ncbi:MAG: hypothetical protein LQ349_007434, partial [Xanthoria aureola]
MAPQDSTKKRKAITRDSSAADEIVLSDGGGDLEAFFLEGSVSQSEDDASHLSISDVSAFDEEESDDLEESEESGEQVGSDEVPSDREQKKVNGTGLNGSAGSISKLAWADED